MEVLKILANRVNLTALRNWKSRGPVLEEQQDITDYRFCSGSADREGSLTSAAKGKFFTVCIAPQNKVCV